MESPSTSETPAQGTTGAAGTSGAKPPLTRAKRWRQNLLLLLISTTITLILAEFCLRWAIYHGGPSFKAIQEPGKYFYHWDPGYWRMAYALDSNSRPPKHPHPYLGWLQKADPVDYGHEDAPKVGARRPVLLYGDSFSACVPEVDCFEDILNADTAFTRDNFLLNYGVGGYGVCQASLLCRKTAPHYQKPLVVFGLLTTDLDRTILPDRCGQKPYYDIENGQLALKGYPIDSVPAHYYDQQSVGAGSYLLRWLIHSKVNFLPYRFTNWYDEKDRSIAHIEDVNRLLIGQLAAELRQQQLDFVFLVFHFEDDMMSPHSEDNWRDQFLRKTLADNQIPYIWSKDIIRNHRLAHPENKHEDYVIPGNGHPTTLYNSLISAEIAKVAAALPPRSLVLPDTLKEELYAARAWNRARQIRADSASYQTIVAKAAANGRTVDEQLTLDAYYLMHLELANERPFAPDGVFEGKWKVK